MGHQGPVFLDRLDLPGVVPDHRLQLRIGRCDPVLHSAIFLQESVIDGHCIAAGRALDAANQ